MEWNGMEWNASVAQHPLLCLYTSVFQSLVTALVLCRLDYGNSSLVGLQVCNNLQRRFQNAAARLIFRLRRSDCITMMH